MKPPLSPPVKPPFVALWVMILLLIALAISAGYGIWQKHTNFRSVMSPTNLLNGKTSLAWEEWFNRALPWREVAIEQWGALSYRVFNTGKEGVVIGRDGWLFTNEEYEVNAHDIKELATKISWIQTTALFLHKRGSRLIVVPVPAKARIYPQHLASAKPLPQKLHATYDMFLGALRDSHIDVVDIATPMREAASKKQLFFKGDTHWTLAGAQLSAKTVAAYVSDLPYFHIGTTIQCNAQVKPFEGDLHRFIPMGFWKHLLGVEQEKVAPCQLSQEILEKDGSEALFGNVVPPFTLVGTSYSAIERWHFTDFLKEALQADILNVADEGEGPFTPMLAYLKRLQTGEAVPNYVLWEIPERYLHKPYNLNYAAIR